MKKFIFVLVLTVLLLPVFYVTAIAEEDVDYAKIYMDFANDSDENEHNPLNYASGLMLIDLNKDNVPELFAFSSSNTYFDKYGNKINPNNDNVAYAEVSHSLDKAFLIINGEVVEDTPWGTESIPMPFLPDEEVTDTNEFCTTTQYRGREDYLMMYVNKVGDWGPYYTAIWYDKDGLEYSHEGFSENLFETFSITDLPVVSIEFYDDKEQRLRTHGEAMQILLNKYKDAANNSEYIANTKLKTSDWAADEVNKAKSLNLIPSEMMHDDLTQNITRAEFTGIAVELLKAVMGTELNWHGGYIVDIYGNPYEDYIRGAYIYGITAGTSGTEAEGVVFSPDLNITREQLATMLCRVIKLNKFEGWTLEKDSDFPLDISNTTKFSDDSSISPYANEAVYYMSKHGIIKGVDSTHFAPQDTATKEQAIILALRIYNAKNELLSNT